MGVNQGKMRLGRALTIWAGSVVCVGLLLFFYGGVPLLPILAAGLFSLGVTLFRHFRSKKNN